MGSPLLRMQTGPFQERCGVCVGAWMSAVHENKVRALCVCVCESVYERERGGEFISTEQNGDER